MSAFFQEKTVGFGPDRFLCSDVLVSPVLIFSLSQNLLFAVIVGATLKLRRNPGVKMVNRKEESIRASLHRLLSEKIYTDITIKTSDGSTEAHRAILAEKSPVFYNMFAHGFIEKESSKIEINDTSIEEFQAFLDYIYGSIPSSEFLKHRTALLKAADKYDVSELKTTCEESLIEDLSPSNVLESLEHAFLYQLLKLKRSCLDYLVSLGKTGGIPHGFHEFTKSANREALVELVSHLLIAMRNSNSCSDPEHVMTYKQEKRFFFHSDLD